MMHVIARTSILIERWWINLLKQNVPVATRDVKQSVKSSQLRLKSNFFVDENGTVGLIAVPAGNGILGGLMAPEHLGAYHRVGSKG